MNLELETTSLAIINWLMLDRSRGELEEPLFSNNIEKGIKFIVSSIEDGGRMGST